jgi:hypothetical protein
MGAGQRIGAALHRALVAGDFATGTPAAQLGRQQPSCTWEMANHLPAHAHTTSITSASRSKSEAGQMGTIAACHREIFAVRCHALFDTGGVQR